MATGSSDSIMSKLTVFLSTYNQEAFVAEAIESVLGQRTDFAFEVLCADDCSTDGTLGILEGYASRFPGRIRVVSPAANLGATWTLGDCLEQNPIMAELLPHVTGEYVAWLDGDDYWTCSTKLQRQVDFLDSQKECSLAFHLADNVFPDGSQSVFYGHDPVRPHYDLEDIVLENFICSSTVVHRTGLLGTIPSAFSHIPADWLFMILFASQGRLAFLNESWAVRRVHPGGMISMKSRGEKIRLNLKWLDVIDDYLQGRFHDAIERRKVELHELLAQTI